MYRPNCSWNYNQIKYKVVYDGIIYILYYILDYIQHNRGVSLDKNTEKETYLHILLFCYIY